MLKWDAISGSLNPGATPPIDEAAYTGAHPYYAELCALSELRKKPGFGPELRSGVGGHCLLYLNGVRLDRKAGYPVLELCPPDAEPGKAGAGISVNSHYKNANWVAFEGADFVWRGALQPGERLTFDAYRRTQRQAVASGALTGVKFHDHLFQDKPAGMAEIDFMYEISVATDYALCFGRDVYRARVPLDALRMAAIVNYLNALNTPYRNGERDYVWRLFTDNCMHVTRNALAAAGVWAPWPSGQKLLPALFNFPVPKNGFVDLMRRTNDLAVADPVALFKDKAARNSLFANGALPAAPGALASCVPAIADNAVYDTDRLRLIFFENPFYGPYRHHFSRIFKQPRYFDTESNLRHFEAVYKQAARHDLTEMQAGNAEQRFFATQYATYIAAMRAAVARALTRQTEAARPEAALA